MDQQVLKPVPIFYCCYLLQSICKRQSFYIGSTPNPVRRLRQHNGILTRGGAYRTKREGTRPWEMIMVVYGFPSKIAALQFEHAWQHGYSTHYIADDERIVKKKNGGRTIHHKLGTARLLAKNVYFQRMDIMVHFFNSDVESIWMQNKFDINDMGCVTIGNSKSPTIAPTVENAIAYSELNLKLVEEFLNGFADRDMEVCQIFQERLTFGEIPCGICQVAFDYTSDDSQLKPFVAFCLHQDCSFVAHLGCLHRYFLDEEQLQEGVRHLIPKSGKCPDCSKIVKWTHLVKYSTMLKSCYGA